MRILLIEDDNHYRRAIKAYIEMLGHEVIDASDPGWCPHYLSRSGHCNHREACGDLLLIDQNMPRLSGLEFMRRQLERGCMGGGMRKALMSAHLDEGERALAMELGCTLLRKPFRLHQLRDWIEEAIVALSGAPPSRSVS